MDTELMCIISFTSSSLYPWKKTTPVSSEWDPDVGLEQVLTIYIDVKNEWGCTYTPSAYLQNVLLN